MGYDLGARTGKGIASKMAVAQPQVASVYVWLVPLAALGDPETASYRRILSADERDRLERFRVTGPAQQFLTARALLRAALAEETGVPAGNLSFDYTAYGKPYVAAPAPARGTPCNVSHTHGLVACAIGENCTPGVDVETIERDLDVQRISDGYFCESEKEALQAQAPAERQARFFKTWTLKEAYIKARGKGLSIALDSFLVTSDDQKPTIHFDPAAGEDAGLWRLATARVDAKHQLAVAAQCPQADTTARIELRWTIPRVDEADRTRLNPLNSQTIIR